MVEKRLRDYTKRLAEKYNLPEKMIKHMMKSMFFHFKTSLLTATPVYLRQVSTKTLVFITRHYENLKTRNFMQLNTFKRVSEYKKAFNRL